jgi:hypothetical protein
MATFIIANTDRHLYSLNPNGTTLKELTGSNWKKNRIGENKKMTMTFESAASIDGYQIVFNPAMFLNPSAPSPFIAGQIPSEAYFYQNDASSTPGTYTMFLQTIIPYSQGVLKNFDVTIEIVSNSVFTITMTYFQIYDLQSYLNSSLENNRSKLLKDTASNVNDLVVTGSNIYSQTNLCPIQYLLVIDPTDPATFGTLTINFSGYQAGFYSKDEANLPSFFTNPVFTLYDTTPAVQTELSIAYNSKIKFTIDSGGSTIDKVLFWLIRTDTNDNSIDFYDNYDASFAEILTSGSGTIDNKLIAPSQEITLVSGNTFDAFAHVDKSLLNVGEKYRFIAIVYLDEYGSFNVNSFISDEYVVGVPTFTGGGYTFDAKLSDYMNEYTGNDLTCVVEERMKSTTEFGYNYTAFQSDMLNRLGLVLPDNDIRRYLTTITATIYEEIGNTIQILKRDIATKTNPTTYSTPSDMTLNFADDTLVVDWNWRNRYEDNIANIQTIVNGVPLTTPTSTQDWGGRNLKISIEFTLFYDDYVAPFSDTIQIFQAISVKDYNFVDLEILNADDTAIPSNYISGTDPALASNLYLANPEEYKLITTGEVSTGTIGSIEENETFIDLLPQLTSLLFNNQESDYSQTIATKGLFSLSSSVFLLNLQYKISALAKRDTGAVVIPADARITEDDILRDLETIDFREIE